MIKNYVIFNNDTAIIELYRQVRNVDKIKLQDIITIFENDLKIQIDNIQPKKTPTDKQLEKLKEKTKALEDKHLIKVNNLKDDFVKFKLGFALLLNSNVLPNIDYYLSIDEFIQLDMTDIEKCRFLFVNNDLMDKKTGYFYVLKQKGVNVGYKENLLKLTNKPFITDNNENLYKVFECKTLEDSSKKIVAFNNVKSLNIVEFLDKEKDYITRYPFQVKIIKPEDFKNYINYFDGSNIIGFDYETNITKNFGTSDIVSEIGIGLADETGKALYIAFEFTYINDHQPLQYKSDVTAFYKDFEIFLKNNNKKVYAFNINFEENILKSRLGYYYDLEDAYAYLTADQCQSGLKEACCYHLNTQPWADLSIETNSIWLSYSTEDVAKYCGLDAYYTTLLVKYFKDNFKYEYAYQCYIDNLHLGAKANSSGISIDEPKYIDYKDKNERILHWSSNIIDKFYQHMLLKNSKFNNLNQLKQSDLTNYLDYFAKLDFANKPSDLVKSIVNLHINTEKVQDEENGELTQFINIKEQSLELIPTELKIHILQFLEMVENHAKSSGGVLNDFLRKKPMVVKQLNEFIQSKGIKVEDIVLLSDYNIINKKYNTFNIIPIKDMFSIDINNLYTEGLNVNWSASDYTVQFHELLAEEFKLELSTLLFIKNQKFNLGEKALEGITTIYNKFKTYYETNNTMMPQMNYHEFYDVVKNNLYVEYKLFPDLIKHNKFDWDCNWFFNTEGLTIIDRFTRFIHFMLILDMAKSEFKLSSDLFNRVKKLSHKTIIKGSFTYRTELEPNNYSTDKDHYSLSYCENYNVNDKNTKRWSSGIHTQRIFKGYESFKFLRARKGKILSYFDISQAEVRTIAMLSGDKNLQKIFELKIDPYYDMVDKVFPGLDKETRKEYRVYLKAVVLGILYGRGVKSIAMALEQDINLIQNLLDLWNDTYQTMNTYKNGLKDYAGKHGRVQSFFGDRIAIEPDRVATVSCNYVIQNSTAVILAQGFNNLINQIYKMGFECRLQAVVHDSITLEVDADKIDTYVELYQEHFKNYLNQKYGIIYEYDCMWGRNFKAYAKYKDGVFTGDSDVIVDIADTYGVDCEPYLDDKKVIDNSNFDSYFKYFIGGDKSPFIQKPIFYKEMSFNKDTREVIKL